MSVEVSKLALSPLFIVLTMLCILHLIILRKENGCMTSSVEYFQSFTLQYIFWLYLSILYDSFLVSSRSRSEITLIIYVFSQAIQNVF
jgi:hypothetical protein